MRGRRPARNSVMMGSYLLTSCAIANLQNEKRRLEVGSRRQKKNPGPSAQPTKNTTSASGSGQCACDHELRRRRPIRPTARAKRAQPPPPVSPACAAAARHAQPSTPSWLRLPAVPAVPPDPAWPPPPPTPPPNPPAPPPPVRQSPPEQLPLGHGVPSGRGVYWQPPGAAHESSVHGFWSSQVSGVPRMQTPPWQVSIPLHGSPSEQGVPLGAPMHGLAEA